MRRRNCPSNSVMGMRGEPRPDSFPANEGLWNKPTVINNVETMLISLQLFVKGRLVCLIGNREVKGQRFLPWLGKLTTMVHEVPMGTTIGEIVFDIGGGIPDLKKYKAVQTKCRRMYSYSVLEYSCRLRIFGGTWNNNGFRRIRGHG